MTKRFLFSGIVQGLGFRPTAQRLALEKGLTGRIKNTGGGTELILCGEKQALDETVGCLASIFDIKSFSEEITDESYDDFRITHSKNDSALPFITPDLATCEECEKELFDKNNRRYRHPFISCINCGVRYSVIRRLPYDRENITMDAFNLCGKCEKEYTSVQDRRCHAQTIACNDCGPRLNMPIEKACEILKSGGVLALKNTGGYHLACRADCREAVLEIRSIKGREKKPFAVMFRNLEQIGEYCKISDTEKELLLSPARPIVLLEKLRDFDESVCGRSEYIGAFLPSDPVQLLILNDVSPLIMTSANISGEPIITDDDEIRKFGVPVLSHDREILTPLDDSVVFVSSGRLRFIRRARGYVPLAIKIDKKAKCDTLLTGGDLKSSFAYHSGEYVFLSQHFGDLEDEKAFKAYRDNIRRFANLHSFKTERVCTDAHPNYISANFLKADKKIYHHEAHCASVIAEHSLKGEVLCFAFDGTGYGEDGNIWGSEVFIYDGKSFDRIRHLDYVTMPASDEISRDCRLALSVYTGGNKIIDSAVKAGVNTVKSSSMGRLFDAVAGLLGVCAYNSFEGEGAQLLEAFAKRAQGAFEFELSWSPKDIIRQAQKATESHGKNEIALGFHLLIADLIINTAREKNIRQVALSGGTFLNRIITERVISVLEAEGFEVYTNELVPCGDGGLALGQAYIAATED